MFVCEKCGIICFGARAFFSHKRSCDFDHDIHSSTPILNNPNDVHGDADCEASGAMIPDDSALPDTLPDIGHAESNQGEYKDAIILHESFPQDSPHGFCRWTPQ